MTPKFPGSRILAPTATHFTFLKGLGLSPNVLILSLTVAALVTILFSWNRLLPLILRNLGATDLQISLVFGLLPLAFSLLQWPGGLLADRLGRKFLIVVPTYIAAAAYLALPLAPAWSAIVLLLVLVNLMSALQMPAFTSLIAESTPPERRGTVFAVYGFFLGLSLALGPLAGAFLLPRLGYRPLIYATGLVTLLAALVRHRFLQETTGLLSHPGIKEHTLTMPQAGRPAHFARPHILSPSFWFLVGEGTFLNLFAGLTIFGPFVTFYWRDVLAFSEQEINLLFGLGPLVAIPLTLMGGRLIDRFGSHDVFRLALLPAAVAFLLLLALPSLLGNALSFATGYLLTQIAFASFDTLRSGIPTSSRGTLLGTLGTITGLLSSTGVPLAGYLKEAFGPSLPFYLAAFTAVAGTLFDFLLQKSLSRDSPVAPCRK